MEIRRIRAEEGSQLRALRLRALAEAPYAFAMTLAEAKQDPLDRWEQRAARGSASQTTATFVCIEGVRWHGMAVGFFVPDQPGVVQVAGVWVNPAFRRLGLGGSLLEAVAGWARRRNASGLQLWVTRANAAALTLYRRSGFTETDLTRPLPWDSSLLEVLMTRPLGDAKE